MEPTASSRPWRSNTILYSSPEFRTQYQKLTRDRSTGIFAEDAHLTVPDEFDGRKVWSKFIAPVRNQGSCGACWAFASTFALQTRLAIATGGEYNLNLSPSVMVLCNMGSDVEFTLAKAQVDNGEPYDFNLPWKSTEIRRKEVESVSKVGCEGETLIGAWQYLYRFGVPEEDCAKYDSDTLKLSRYYKGYKMPACADVMGDSYDTCPSNKQYRQAHLSSGYYHVPGTSEGPDKGTFTGTELNIRRDIYHWGPATTGFTVHSDFMGWDGKGVYKWDGKSAEEGGHAVVILGWGKDAVQGPFWIVRNSWGDSWGDGGYFKINRGSNECGIEENVVVGLPGLFGFRLYLEWPLLLRTEDLMLKALWGVKASGYKVTVFEDMIRGKIDGSHAEVYSQQYSPKKWPDVSTFVAGDPGTLRFRIAESIHPVSHPINFAMANGDLVIGVAIGVSLCVVGFWVYKNIK